MARLTIPHKPDKIDQILLDSLHTDVAVSGEELSAKLGISRAAISKRMIHLKQFGYPICAAPRKGYWFADDSLMPETVSRCLQTQQLGRYYLYEPTVESTFVSARRMEAEGAPHGAVVVAETQTAGRGRLGRTWISQVGKGIYFTMLLRPDLPTAQAARLTPAAAVGVAQALRKLGFSARIKWPNDIVIKGKKVCGILLEMGGDMDDLRYVSIGIGINVLQQKEDFPEELHEKATSLLMHTDTTLSRSSLLCAVLHALERTVTLCSTDFEVLLVEYRTLSATLGQHIKASGGASVEGLAVDISADGELIVRDYAGTLHTLHTGDVSVRGVMGYV